MNSNTISKILILFAFLSLFIQLTALVSLQVMAVYVFGGATIVFALLAAMVASLDD